jgi:hypothetical protein
MAEVIFLNHQRSHRRQLEFQTALAIQLARNSDNRVRFNSHHITISDFGGDTILVGYPESDRRPLTRAGCMLFGQSQRYLYPTLWHDFKMHISPGPRGQQHWTPATYW